MTQERRRIHSKLVYDEVRLLRRLLREAAQYVSDAGSDEDAEAQTNSAALLAEINAALSE